MQTLSTSHYLILAAILFCMGMLGVLIRRNALVVFMCIELMLNAANLTFLAFSREQGNDIGQLSAFFIIAVAAAEVVVGMAIFVALFRHRATIDVNRMNTMKD